MSDRYGRDGLGSDPGAGLRRRAPTAREVVAAPGTVVEDAETGWCGAVARLETVDGVRVVSLEDRHGRVRGFPLGAGFLLDGAPVRLVAPPRQGAAARPARTASGSVAVPGAPARVAAGSRIFVEGRHDAELVEKVWGDDLRVEGVVVELLEGVDQLASTLVEFRPRGHRRAGVLVDHLVAGSKESRLVDEALAATPGRSFVKVLGHPYVDVWQSVRPQRLGLSAWPEVARGRSWKHGVLAELGWPHATQADVAAGWRRILASVRTYADLEPTLLASVEELIDFVCAPATSGG